VRTYQQATGNSGPVGIAVVRTVGNGVWHAAHSGVRHIIP
jgi:hypothetical protein